MKIRGAVESDAEAIAQLTTELGYPTSRAQMIDRLHVLLPDDAHFIAVAEKSSRIVGFVAAEERLLLESGERVEIVGLVVAADARRLGIGRALVLEAEAWAEARGHETINVRSNVAREEAHPFYESLDYVRAKTQHAYTKPLTR